MRWLGLLLAVAMVHAAHAAEPDFSTSTATFEPVPAVAGDIVSYRVSIANTGADSTYTRIVTPLPRGYFVRADGDCTAAGVTDDRLLWHEGGFAAGTSKECRVDILTRPDSAGTIATLATEITTPPSGYLRIEARPTLESRPDRTSSRWTFGITPAGIVTLALLARRRHRRRDRRGSGEGGAVKWRLGAWIASLRRSASCSSSWISRGAIFAATPTIETSCLIVDSSIRSFQGSGRAVEHVCSEFAVHTMRWRADLQRRIRRRRRQRRVIRSSQQAIEAPAVGSSHPCWFDPDDVKTVLLERGPGAAYIFAAPLIMLADLDIDAAHRDRAPVRGVVLQCSEASSQTPGP